MARTPLTGEQCLVILTETPERIAQLTADAPAEVLHAAAVDEWSANDVLAHLRACSDVWGGNIAAMAAEDKPTWKAVNPRTWIDSTDYPKRRFQPSLREFTTQRAELLATLGRLSPKTGHGRRSCSEAAHRTSPPSSTSRGALRGTNRRM